MQKLLEWISTLDLSAIYASIVAFISIWGGSIIALVIGLLKTRLKNINYQKALNELNIDLTEKQNKAIEDLRKDLINELHNIQSNILKQDEANAQERLDKIGLLTKEVNEANEEVQKTKSINDILNEVI